MKWNYQSENFPFIERRKQYINGVNIEIQETKEHSVCLTPNPMYRTKTFMEFLIGMME